VVCNRFVTFSAKIILLGLLVASSALATTQISTQKPIVNFRLPWFTPEGYRAWMVRGSEARYVAAERIDIKDLTLSVFTGLADEKVDTLLLSPDAVVNPDAAVVTGSSTIRVISGQFEATGTEWSYAHKDKKVSIAKNVRVTFNAEFKDFLK
jgi:lipopolysaccharide export system protein LptC